MSSLILYSFCYCFSLFILSFFFFFFNDTATTEIYTLSLHDALPISQNFGAAWGKVQARSDDAFRKLLAQFIRFYAEDRKSTRLNSSHGYISYAVFCLNKKKKNKKKIQKQNKNTKQHTKNHKINSNNV